MNMNKSQKLSGATDASMYKYPYQNLSLVDMEGEIWKPLPGAEEYYMVSNKSRIKTIPRLFERTLQGITFSFLSKEKMCLQNIEIRYNSYLKKTRTNLRFCGKSGKKYSSYVCRLVYAAFVEKVPDGSMVMHRDNDPLNNCVENLYLVSDRKIIAKTRLNSITQYDRQGNPIQTFESIKEASIQLKLNSNCIAMAVRGKAITAGGYLFRKGLCTEKIDTLKLGVHPRMKRASASHKIAKYDTFGNLIEMYPSMTDAAIQNNCCADVIEKCLKGQKERVRLQHIKQYDWKYMN